MLRSRWSMPALCMVMIKSVIASISGSNVVVRVNDLPKGASVTLTVLSSNAAGIMDIAVAARCYRNAQKTGDGITLPYWED